MNKKIGLTELFNAQLGDNFDVGYKLVDIGINADSLAKYAEKLVTQEGEFAKVYADQYAEGLRRLSALALEAVTLLVNNKLAEDEVEQEKALNNIG